MTAKQTEAEYATCEWDNVELRDVYYIRPWRLTIVGMQVIAETAVIMLGVVLRKDSQWEPIAV